MADEKQLIDANDVYSLFDVNGFANLHITDIDVIPRADVESVRHGRWVQQPLNGTHIWRCSKCETIGSPQWNYCPKCGAKMGDKLYG